MFVSNSIRTICHSSLPNPHVSLSCVVSVITHLYESDTGCIGFRGGLVCSFGGGEGFYGCCPAAAASSPAGWSRHATYVCGWLSALTRRTDKTALWGCAMIREVEVHWSWGRGGGGSRGCGSFSTAPTGTETHGWTHKVVLLCDVCNCWWMEITKK